MTSSHAKQPALLSQHHIRQFMELSPVIRNRKFIKAMVHLFLGDTIPHIITYHQHAHRNIIDHKLQTTRTLNT